MNDKIENPPAYPIDCEIITWYIPLKEKLCNVNGAKMKLILNRVGYGYVKNIIVSSKCAQQQKGVVNLFQLMNSLKKCLEGLGLLAHIVNVKLTGFLRKGKKQLSVYSMTGRVYSTFYAYLVTLGMMITRVTSSIIQMIKTRYVLNVGS